MTVASYTPPAEGVTVTEPDVHRALAFLIAIEPDPEDETFDGLEDDAYDAMMRANLAQGEAAIATLRRFAQQRQPESLEAMQAAYYSFTNDPRYLGSAHISSIVTSSLNQGWDGVGSWRR